MKKSSVNIFAYIFLVAPLMFFVLEFVSAMAWQNPTYSYLQNYVSDLGVPVDTVFQGRHINSPLHALMNFNFIAYAILILIATIGISPSLKIKRKNLGIGLLIAHSLGFILVGLFPGYDWWGGIYHSIGAIPVIFGGNLGIMALGSAVGKSTHNRFFSSVSILLGLVGLVGIFTVLYLASKGLGYQGLFERIAIYPTFIWEIFFGTALLQNRISGQSN